MKKNVQDTSIEAYYTHSKAKRNEEALYEFMKGKPAMADFQIIDAMGWNVNEVTGRRNDLIAKHLVKAVGHTYNPITRKMVKTWIAVSPQTYQESVQKQHVGPIQEDTREVNKEGLLKLIQIAKQQLA